MNGLVFTLAYLGICLFGLPAAFHPLFRQHRLLARLAASFLLGAVLLTLTALIWSLLGVPWTVWTLGVPLFGLSVAGAAVLARRESTGDYEGESVRSPTPLHQAALALTFAALAFLAWQLITTRATSPDFLFFWGVKGLRFAEAGGIDPLLLKWPFFTHAHINYPPLLPTTFAWGALVAGGIPWIWTPTLSWIWIASTAAVLGPILQPLLGSTRSAVLTAVWSVTLSASMIVSISGGNAEAPLVAFLTVACAILLARTDGGPSSQWTIVALAFVGAVLTKNEGPVSVALLGGGALLRAGIERDRRSALRIVGAGAAAIGAIGLWALFLATNALPLTDPIRQRAGNINFDHIGEILAAAPAGLDVGTATLSWWVLAIAVLASKGRRLTVYLPAAALCFGLLGFAFVYYLHSENDPTILIGWTLARLCQPALSALVLWAGLTWMVDDQQSN